MDVKQIILHGNFIAKYGKKSYFAKVTLYQQRIFIELDKLSCCKSGCSCKKKLQFDIPLSKVIGALYKGTKYEGMADSEIIC